MRARKLPVDLLSAIRLREIVRLDKVLDNRDSDNGNPYDTYTLAGFLEAPEPPEDPNEVVTSETFTRIHRGTERICVVLRSEGFMDEAITAITGFSAQTITKTFETIRQRLAENRS